MSELPSGTVTFIFTDIEGSTALLESLGPSAYAEALAGHRVVLREVFTRHGGTEVDTQGDAFFVAFPTATGALAAAADGQEELMGGVVAVRIGIHTGEPLATGEGYVGMDVHRAARIAAAGHGGQVLLSATTAALLGDSNSLLQALPLTDLGLHRLKDLGAAQRLYQLGTAEFPPLKTIGHTNLPVPATPFLGRAREVRELVELLGRPDVRLVTLTGPGGTGKTRLALQVAAELADAYPDGVTWVALAPIRDADLVLPAIAGALGIRVGERESLPDAIARALGHRQALLLLDNLEQVVHVAPQLATLLTACPDLDLLVTSREPLQVAAEHVVPLDPLVSEDALALFVARAKAASPAFEASLR